MYDDRRIIIRITMSNEHYITSAMGIIMSIISHFRISPYFQVRVSKVYQLTLVAERGWGGGGGWQRGTVSPLCDILTLIQ